MARKEGPTVTIGMPLNRRLRDVALPIIVPAVAIIWPIHTGWFKHIAVAEIVAYLAVFLIPSVWMLYQLSRTGIRFDDTGIKVRGVWRTRRVAWGDVSRLADDAVTAPEGGGVTGSALRVELRDGKPVTTYVLDISAPTLALLKEAAARYQIKADLTDKVPDR